MNMAYHKRYRVVTSEEALLDKYAPEIELFGVSGHPFVSGIENVSGQPARYRGYGPTLPTTDNQEGDQFDLIPE